MLGCYLRPMLTYTRDCECQGVPGNRLGRLGDFGIGEGLSIIGSSVISAGGGIGQAIIGADATRYVAKKQANTVLAQTISAEKIALQQLEAERQDSLLRQRTTESAINTGSRTAILLGLAAAVVYLLK